MTARTIERNKLDWNLHQRRRDPETTASVEVLVVKTNSRPRCGCVCVCVASTPIIENCARHGASAGGVTRGDGCGDGLCRNGGRDGHVWRTVGSEWDVRGWACTGDDATEGAGAGGRADMPVLSRMGLEAIRRGEGVRSSDGKPGETFLSRALCPHGRGMVEEIKGMRMDREEQGGT